MEYSIQELSRLSGVTTRTLRWYDQIDLLKPSRVAESGYRYYSETEVDRLQDIGFTRNTRTADFRFMQREPHHTKGTCGEDRRFRFSVEPHCQRRNENGQQ